MANILSNSEPNYDKPITFRNIKVNDIMNKITLNPVEDKDVTGQYVLTTRREYVHKEGDATLATIVKSDTTKDEDKFSDLAFKNIKLVKNKLKEADRLHDQQAVKIQRAKDGINKIKIHNKKLQDINRLKYMMDFVVTMIEGYDDYSHCNVTDDDNKQFIKDLIDQICEMTNEYISDKTKDMEMNKPTISAELRQMRNNRTNIINLLNDIRFIKHDYQSKNKSKNKSNDKKLVLTAKDEPNENGYRNGILSDGRKVYIYNNHVYEQVTAVPIGPTTMFIVSIVGNSETS